MDREAGLIDRVDGPSDFTAPWAAAALAWLRLARPRLLPFVWALVLAGYGWAHWERALPATGGAALVRVLAAWALLHAGTLWLNAATDRDQGAVLLGATVEPPRGTRLAGRAALCVALGIGATTPAWHALWPCAVLAELYSLPATRWKAHPLGGPLVNLAGYGLLSPLAGHLCVGVPQGARTAWAGAALAMGVLGCYFVAQAFQGDEDRARGDRTLVATHGPRVTLAAARVCFGVVVLIGAGLVVAGWVPRACGIGVALAWWVDTGLRGWQAKPEGGTVDDAVAVARRLLVAAGVVFVAAFAEYARASFAGEAVAGLGTIAGR